MPEAPQPLSQPPQQPSLAPTKAKSADEAPSRIMLVPYPKIVFLYPAFLMSLVAAAALSFIEQPLDPQNRVAVALSAIFLGILAVNIVILAFDFPRTTSLTLFFFIAAVVMGMILLFVYRPDMLPFLTGVLERFHPLANATFYWTFAGIMAAIFLAVMIAVRFDYWEVRPNELLHHHGFLANLERLAAPNLRIDKEINDVFEYFLLRSGRLIIHPSDERKAIILDNVPFITKKEGAITRMLGALQVQVRKDNAEQ
jgi:hypothetical protein